MHIKNNVCYVFFFSCVCVCVFSFWSMFIVLLVFFFSFRWCCWKWDFRWFVRLKCFELEMDLTYSYYLFGSSINKGEPFCRTGKDNSTVRMNLTYVRCSSVESMFFINRWVKTAHERSTCWTQKVHRWPCTGHMKLSKMFSSLLVRFFFLEWFITRTSDCVASKAMWLFVFGCNQKRHHKTIGERKIAFDSKTLTVNISGMNIYGLVVKGRWPSTRCHRPNQDTPKYERNKLADKVVVVILFSFFENKINERSQIIVWNAKKRRHQLSIWFSRSMRYLCGVSAAQDADRWSNKQKKRNAQINKANDQTTNCIRDSHKIKYGDAFFLLRQRRHLQ